MSISSYARSPRAVSEMEIVDTFTKLIFGGEAHYTDFESDIIRGLRNTDPHVTFDSHADMGIYLRALGVKEMVKLVSQVRLEMSLSHSLPPTPSGPGVHSSRLPLL